MASVNVTAYCTKRYPARRISPQRMLRKGCEDAKKQRRGRCKWLLSLETKEGKA